MTCASPSPASLATRSQRRQRARTPQAPITIPPRKSGTEMFVLESDLQVPSELALSELRRELDALADQENLDVILESKG